MTRVNLLVGKNNAGKTSVLEAAEILAAGGRPWSLLRSPTRRGDGSARSVDGRPGASVILDVHHLFHGHKAEPGTSLRVEGKDPELHFVELRIETWKGRPSGQLGRPVGEAEDIQPLLALTIKSDQSIEPSTLQLVRGGGLSIDEVLGSSPVADAPVNYIGTTDVDFRLGEFWDRIVLTPVEGRVVEALQIIEPEIERIASLSRPSGRAQLAGIVVKLRGSDERIPIGSLGEGLKRLLVLTANLVNVPGGLLLVDEIDTGLHFSVLTRMWKLLIEVARNLDVQVLATTHSFDCLRALAETYERNRGFGDDLSVFRIQRGRESAVRYSADEILSAVEHDMEIR